MRRFLAALLLLTCSAGFCSGFAWKEELRKVLPHTDPRILAPVVEKILAARPPWAELAAVLGSPSFPRVHARGCFQLRLLRGKDGKERPWVVYVPRAYDHRKPAPLLVVLHGGVSREAIKEDPIGYAGESPWIKPAEEQGWLVLHPFGQHGATWWDEVGMDNISRQIRLIKSQYNIDDDRVYLAGFSDGASAGFLFAMVRPTDFAGVVALNGHMGVGSLDGNLPTYAPNLANTPVYTVTTDEDSLYPTVKMAPTLAMARRAGADILCRELNGGHEFSYAETEMPRLVAFLRRHPRDPHPSRIFWETGAPDFGRCSWFAIDSVKPEAAADWHNDHNCVLVDDRVTIGFISVDLKNEGVGVGHVVPDSFAAKIKLTTGDVIVSACGRDIRNIDDLNAAKAAVKRGDPFPLTIRRAGKTIHLKGNLPPALPYYLFKREVPSAAARVEVAGNRVEIEGSRLGVIRILVHPDRFRLEENLVVTVNGKVVHDQLVEPDVEFMLRNFLAERDRRLLYVAEVKITLT